jgi:small subunit ribosomal protein S17
MMTEQTSSKQTLIGRVTSNKMTKTVTVLIERKVKHPLYDKVVKKSNKFHAHDEASQCGEGDLVEISPIRPMSKTKSWNVVRVIQKAVGV